MPCDLSASHDGPCGPDCRVYGPEPAPIHAWFGPDRASESYLVVPRVVLQSMPPDWQRRLIVMLDEAAGTFGVWPRPGTFYDVELCGRMSCFGVPDPLFDYGDGRRRLVPIAKEADHA